ncbi:STAS domain-containing protein [Peribacillus muralis]|uniref:STAS domain-containing protein n=1 Tax=Peribacillus muralis TaxID=264697 RepID=UPI001F4DD341|nr:STAS domain-containing protein [Peribacillus muralis]MCK1994237.1 STAS domain-containing protein [Peribacillus muralis]MCK2014978.1 STAS domain-containing protein [Peribacillus muralis]
MEQLRMIGEKIEKFKNILVEHIELFDEEDSRYDLETSKQVRSQLIQIHADALIHGKEQAMSSMKATGMIIGKRIVDMGISLDKSIEEAQLLRNLFWSFIEEEVSNRYYSIEILLKASSIIDSILDQYIHCISISYVNHYKQMATVANESLQKIKENQEVMEELATPIVQTVLKDVLLFPMIGRVDDWRMESMQSRLLQKCADLHAEVLIIDFSGITFTKESNMLFLLEQLVGALSLMGTETVVVGFTPDVVKRIVKLDFANQVKAFLSFAQAMEFIFKQRGLALQPL